MKRTLLAIAISFCAFCLLHSAGSGDILLVSEIEGMDPSVSVALTSAWFEEDFLSRGLETIINTSAREMDGVPFGSGPSAWKIRTDIRSSGGIIRYRAILFLHDWQVSSDGSDVTGTNGLRSAVRNTVDLFSDRIRNLTPEKPAESDQMTVRNTVLTDSRPETDVPATNLSVSELKPARPANFGGWITADCNFNYTVNDKSGVFYYSAGIAYRQNLLLKNLYFGLKTSYDHYSVALTNSYAYRLEVWKNMLSVSYQIRLPFSLYLETGLDFGGYTGAILYHSSATNMTNSVLGLEIGPRAGIGLDLGNFTVSAGMTFNYGYMNFSSSNYLIMGLVGGASIGWRF